MLTPKIILGLAIVIVAGIFSIRCTLGALVGMGVIAAKGEGCVTSTAGCGCLILFTAVPWAFVYFGLRLAEIIT
jgi:hypothetical protein